MDRSKEVVARLYGLADGFEGYNFNYIFDELEEITDIVWDMIKDCDNETIG